MAQLDDSANRRLVGGALISIGILVAVAQVTGFNLGRSLWPLYIIVPGIVLLVAGARPGELGKGLTIAGSTVTITGLVLAYQNTFDHFQSWAYVWALTAPGAVGLALLVHGRREGDMDTVMQGRRLINLAGALFLAGAVFFELILNISGRGFPHIFTSALVLPAILVIAGITVFFWPRKTV